MSSVTTKNIIEKGVKDKKITACSGAQVNKSRQYRLLLQGRVLRREQANEDSLHLGKVDQKGSQLSRLKLLEREIMPVLPTNIRELLAKLPECILSRAVEIRLRQERPFLLSTGDKDIFIGEDGPAADPCRAYIVNGSDISRVTHLVSKSSIYALEEELRNGFITLPGGHRVGITGKTVLEKGKVKTLKYISGFNIRISREIIGTSERIFPYIIGPGGRVFHTVLVSPPRCGKTTMLRDLIRLISDGVPELGFSGCTVGVVDERSEIAGCYQGVPQLNVGMRTDVLDGCCKAEGMMMLLRAMAPDVIAADEIGRREDIAALEEVLNAGVKVLTTVHGAGLKDLVNRPALRYLLELKEIERFVILGRSRGVGTVEDIIDGETMRSLGVGVC